MVLLTSVQFRLLFVNDVELPTLSNLFGISALVIGSITIDIILLVGIAYFTGVVFYYLAIFPLFVCFFAVGALPNHNLRIYLYVHGFIWAKGKRYETVRWEQVESIWQKERNNNYTPSPFTYIVRLDDGKTIKLSHALKYSYELTTIIDQEVAKKQLPGMIDAYKASEMVRFGKISVDLRGVNNGKELVPWDQVDEITVKEGKVVVQKYGRPLKWSSVKLSETPNCSTLIGLVNFVVNK